MKTTTSNPHRGRMAAGLSQSFGLRNYLEIRLPTQQGYQDVPEVYAILD